MSTNANFEKVFGSVCHNIAKLFNCVSWDHVVSGEDHYVISCLWGAPMLCTMEFSTSNYKFKFVSFVFVDCNLVLWKETIIQLLSNVMVAYNIEDA